MMKNRIVIYISGILIFIVAFILFFILLNMFLPFLYIAPHPSSFKVVLFFLIVFFLPAFVAFYTSKSIVKSLKTRMNLKVTWIPKNKIFVYIMILLYAITAFIGIPSIQSDNNQWALEEYKRIYMKRNREIWEAHPYIQSYFSIPVLPFIVLSYHEYQLTGLYGWGGWDVQCWYIGGVKSILRFPLWIS